MRAELAVFLAVAALAGCGGSGDAESGGRDTPWRFVPADQMAMSGDAATALPVPDAQPDAAASPVQTAPDAGSVPVRPAMPVVDGGEAHPEASPTLEPAEAAPIRPIDAGHAIATDATPEAATPDAEAPWYLSCHSPTSLAELKTGANEAVICVSIAWANGSGIYICPHNQAVAHACSGADPLAANCPEWGYGCTVNVPAPTL